MSGASGASVRNCDGCTLCCKVMVVDPLDKPAGVWCTHCDIGKGCRIYASRPGNCEAFACAYLGDLDLDERWKPSEARFVLISTTDVRGLTAHMDPARPDAWRREPYYSQFKAWSRLAVRSRSQVRIVVGRHTWIVFPDREVDLGIVGNDEVILTATVQTPAGPRYEARKIPHDDPRAAALLAESKQGPGV